MAKFSTSDLDKFRTLLSQSQFSFWIKGNAGLDAFEFVTLTPAALDDVVGLECFCGVVGFQGIVPKIAFAQPLDDGSVIAISQACVSLVEAAITQIEVGRKANKDVRWDELT